MNEIVVTNEREWAEHMYVVFACYVLFMLLCINSFSSRLDMSSFMGVAVLCLLNSFFVISY